MKVLHVIPAKVEEGNITYSNLIKREISFLQRKGLELQTFLFLDQRSMGGILAARKQLKAQIAAFKPDIIHVYTGATTTFLVAITPKKCPWIITFGGSDLLGYHKNGLLWKIRSKSATFFNFFAARKADGIICVSENLKEALESNGIAAKKIAIVPRGIDLDAFALKDKQEARKELGLPAGEKIVLFSQNKSGRLVKNWKLASEVLEKVKSEFKIDTHVVMLMDMTGREIMLHLNAADALLFTSLHEGSPNIVKEAMACNLAIVSVNCGDVVARLANVNNAKVLGYDPDILAEELARTLLSPQQGNGRTTLIAQGLDSGSVANKITGYYESVIKNA